MHLELSFRIGPRVGRLAVTLQSEAHRLGVFIGQFPLVGLLVPPPSEPRDAAHQQEHDHTQHQLSAAASAARRLLLVPRRPGARPRRVFSSSAAVASAAARSRSARRKRSSTPARYAETAAATASPPANRSAACAARQPLGDGGQLRIGPARIQSRHETRGQVRLGRLEDRVQNRIADERWERPVRRTARIALPVRTRRCGHPRVRPGPAQGPYTPASPSPDPRRFRTRRLGARCGVRRLHSPLSGVHC